MGNCKKYSEIIVKASTPEKLLKALTIVCKLLKTGKLDRTLFFYILNKALNEMETFCRTNVRTLKLPGLKEPAVYIYEGMAAFTMFLAFNMHFCKDETELENQLGYMAEFLGRCIAEPRGGMLSPSEAEDLLNTVQDKFGLVSAAAGYKDLDIYMINRSHICYDSFLLTYNKTGNRLERDKWMLFCLSPCMDSPACNKYFVFLHEIGHILYNILTGGKDDIPEMFGEVAFLMGLPINVDIKPEELFSDIFSAASLYNTPYASYNPFKNVISDSIYDFLEMYFRMLVSRVSREYFQSNALQLLH